MQTSAWILAIISVDRYLIITNSQWKQKFSKNIKFNLGVIFIVCLIIAALNVPAAVLNGSYTPISINFNETTNQLGVMRTSKRKVTCYSNWFYLHIWQYFALVFECALPLALMIIFNSLLIHKTYESSIKLQQQQKEQSNKLLQSVSMGSSFNNKNVIKSNRASSFSSLIFANDKKTSNHVKSKLAPKANSSSEGNISTLLYPKLQQIRAQNELKKKDSLNSTKFLTRKVNAVKQTYSLITIPKAFEKESTDSNLRKDSSKSRVLGGEASENENW